MEKMRLHKCDLQDQKKIEKTEKDLGRNATAGISNCRNKLCENVGSHFVKRHMNYTPRSSINPEDQHKSLLMKGGFQWLAEGPWSFQLLTIRSREGKVYSVLSVIYNILKKNESGEFQRQT